jgi:hypothetical protein
MEKINTGFKNDHSSSEKSKKRRRRRKPSKKSVLQSLTPHEVIAQGELSQTSIPTLIALNILTSKGGASPHARRKIKQVTHFLNLLAPALTELFERYENPCIVDMGAGKSAISFALYDRWIRPKNRGQMIAVEQRPALVNKVEEIARNGDYKHFQMVSADILSATLPERVHLVLGLHACDLATDHSLLRALNSKSDYIAMVPCCQAEVAQLLKSNAQSKSSSQSKVHNDLLPLWSDAMHRREFSAHLTNVLRVYVLRSLGYAVTVTELIGWEHSLKNELILARKVGRYHQQSLQQLESLLQQIPIEPWLISTLCTQNLLTLTFDLNTQSTQMSVIEPQID